MPPDDDAEPIMDTDDLLVIKAARDQLQTLAAKVVDTPDAAAELLREVARGRFSALHTQLSAP